MNRAELGRLGPLSERFAEHIRARRRRQLAGFLVDVDEDDPGGDVELWTIPGTDHFPELSATFADSVVGFLLAHPKP